MSINMMCAQSVLLKLLQRKKIPVSLAASRPAKRTHDSSSPLIKQKASPSGCPGDTEDLLDVVNLQPPEESVPVQVSW